MILKELKIFLQKKIYKQAYDEESLCFLIQYSIFKIQGDEWILKCCLTQNESIYDINVSYSEEKTNFKLKSWKGNYPNFRCISCMFPGVNW